MALLNTFLTQCTIPSRYHTTKCMYNKLPYKKNNAQSQHDTILQTVCTMLQDKLYNKIQCYKTNCTIQCYKTIIRCIAQTMLYSKTIIQCIARFNPVDHTGQTAVYVLLQLLQIGYQLRSVLRLQVSLLNSWDVFFQDLVTPKVLLLRGHP